MSLPQSRKKELCLWVIGHNAQVKKIRLTYVRLALVAGFFTMLGITLCLVAGDYTRVQVLRFKNYLLLQQVTNQRDSLAKSNNQLESELTELKDVNTKVMLYEQSVREKLAEISQVVESATTLGVPEEDKDSAITDPLEGGVGGAELDCTGVGGLKNCRLSSWSDVGIRGRLDPSILTSPQQIAVVSNIPKVPGMHPEPKVTWPDNGMLEHLQRVSELLKDLPLASPAKGKINSGFGYRVSPFSHHVSIHEGIDISMSQGLYARSSAAGIVKSIEHNPTYGLVVDVEHNDRITTRYAHLSKILVRKNQKLSVGEKIGLSGSTGRSTGPHLHYEVRLDGRAKNPKSFLSLAQTLKPLM